MRYLKKLKLLFTQSSIAESVEDFQHANASYFKFTIVRHPMDRLLSCYIDKLLSNKEDVNNSMSFSYHVKKRGKQLAMQTSRQLQVVKDIKTIETKAAAATDRVQLNEILPTFEDFLEFVLATPFSQSKNIIFFQIETVTFLLENYNL